MLGIESSEFAMSTLKLDWHSALRCWESAKIICTVTHSFCLQACRYSQSLNLGNMQLRCQTWSCISTPLFGVQSLPISFALQHRHFACNSAGKAGTGLESWKSAVSILKLDWHTAISCSQSANIARTTTSSFCLQFYRLVKLKLGNLRCQTWSCIGTTLFGAERCQFINVSHHLCFWLGKHVKAWVPCGTITQQMKKQKQQKKHIFHPIWFE